MLDVKFSNYEAIALHSLIETLGFLQVLQENQRKELLMNLADDPNLQSASEKLKAALDAEKMRQETRAGMVQGIGSEPAVYARMWGDTKGSDRLPDWGNDE